MEMRGVRNENRLDMLRKEVESQAAMESQTGHLSPNESIELTHEGWRLRTIAVEGSAAQMAAQRDAAQDHGCFPIRENEEWGDSQRLHSGGQDYQTQSLAQMNPRLQDVFDDERSPEMENALRQIEAELTHGTIDTAEAEAPGNSLARARMAVAKLSTSLQVEGQLLQS